MPGNAGRPPCAKDSYGVVWHGVAPPSPASPPYGPGIVLRFGGSRRGVNGVRFGKSRTVLMIALYERRGEGLTLEQIASMMFVSLEQAEYVIGSLKSAGLVSLVGVGEAPRVHLTPEGDKEARRLIDDLGGPF